MQDGVVERFDQKISPRPSFPKRGITISSFGKGGRCEKIEEKRIMSKDLSIISTPQFPKIEFFHSFGE